MALKIEKAVRKQVKLRLGISAISGGGKTYSALKMAYGMVGDWDKIYVIDTENRSASLYAHFGPFNIINLEAPYSPEKYIEAIALAESAGAEIIITDSITHEWDGKGGILEISNNMTGNSYTNWAKLTPRHQAFIDKILQSKCHMITTVRRKTDYELTQNASGKLVPQKVGLKEVTRSGWEYELTVNFELDTKHMVSVSKDRTGMFMDKPEFVITEETGKQIIEWCNEGLSIIDQKAADLKDGLNSIKSCDSMDSLTAIWNANKSIQGDDNFLAAMTEKKEELTK